MKNFILIFCFLWISLASSGQTNSKTTSLQEKRIALVIGNGNYYSDTLANAENDAKAMKAALERAKYE